jgi:hypothetical protein
MNTSCLCTYKAHPLLGKQDTRQHDTLEQSQADTLISHSVDPLPAPSPTVAMIAQVTAPIMVALQAGGQIGNQGGDTLAGTKGQEEQCP